MRPLTHRQSQVELLASACQTHEPVRLELQNSDDQAALAEGHLLACDRGSVLVELTERGGLSPAADQDARTRARFGHRGRRFEFSTTLLARVTFPGANQARSGVRLAMPLVVRERAARAAERVRLPESATIAVELSTLGPEMTRMTSRLVDLAPGGMACESDQEAASRLIPGELLRIEMSGPDAPRGCEFVARVTHVHPLSEPRVRIGLAFVGLDDAAQFDARRKNLEDWIRGAARDERPRCETRDEGEREPC